MLFHPPVFVSSRNRSSSFAKISHGVNSWRLDRDQFDGALHSSIFVESRVSGGVGLRGREWRGVPSIIETSVFRASDYSSQTMHSEHVFALPSIPLSPSSHPFFSSSTMNHAWTGQGHCAPLTASRDRDKLANDRLLASPLPPDIQFGRLSPRYIWVGSIGDTLLLDEFHENETLCRPIFREGKKGEGGGKKIYIYRRAPLNLTLWILKNWIYIFDSFENIGFRVQKALWKTFCGWNIRKFFFFFLSLFFNDVFLSVARKEPGLLVE